MRFWSLLAVMTNPAVRLFVGGHGQSIQGERLDLAGDRMFSAAHRPSNIMLDPARVVGLLDSGAFSDSPAKRLSPEGALQRQLQWEQHASERWSGPWHAHGLVSYDVLIDETWTGTRRHKRRWSVREAEWAVEETISAAQYLASQRQRLAPRRLVLSCQGVDASQYSDCATEILRVAQPGDILGLGGWCILGLWQSWLPEFWATLRAVLPMAASAGLNHIHIFGVLWEPALAGLAWLADQYGLCVSTDSTAPIRSVTFHDLKRQKRAGARRPYWRDNVQWWISHLANLRTSRWYREPPRAWRQLELLGRIAS